MPPSVNKMVFQDPDCKKLAPSKLVIGTYTTNTFKLVGSCVFYLVHPDTKCLQEVAFYVAINNGSVLLSCVTTLALGLIQPHIRLHNPPPRGSLITSSADHQEKNRSKINVHISRQESTMSNHKHKVSKLVTSKREIPAAYPDVFDGIGCFLGSPYHIQVDPSVTSKQSPCYSVPVHLKESYKKEIDMMLQSGVLKPVNQATPWTNSFVFVEGKDKLGNLKLRICLDPTNLNRTIMCEPYFLRPLKIEPIIYDCRKGYWHHEFDEASSFLTTFSNELGRFWYTVMPFGATVAGDVFQRKLDECFGKPKQVIIIANDIMVVGHKPDHSDHNQVFTSLLQIAQKCNVKLNYDKLQYKKDEVVFFGETYTTSGNKPPKSKVSAIKAMPPATTKKHSIIHRYDQLLVKVLCKIVRAC